MKVLVSARTNKQVDVEMRDADDVNFFTDMVNNAITYETEDTRGILKQIYYSLEDDENEQPLLESLFAVSWKL